MKDKDMIDAEEYYKETKGIAKIFLIVFILCVLEIVGLSIWLGFPSPYFNRLAIAIVGYIIGTFLGVASAISFIGVVYSLAECATLIIKEKCK